MTAIVYTRFDGQRPRFGKRFVALDAECPLVQTGSPRVSLTRYTNSGGLLTKRITLVDGSLVKTPAAAMVGGTAERIDIRLAGLPALIAGLNTKQAIGPGIHAERHMKIVRRDAWLSDPKPGTSARSKHCAIFAEGPALFTVDHDPHPRGVPVGSADRLVDMLADIHPPFRDAAHVSAASASSHIYAAGTDTLVGESHGVHVYLAVPAGTDIERFNESLFVHCWLAGHGHIFVSESGSLLERTIFDKTVNSPERLDFIAGAELGEGLVQRRPQPAYTPGGYLDTASLAEPTPDEMERYRLLVAAAKADPPVVEEQRVKQSAWLSARGDEYRQTHPDAREEDVGAHIDDLRRMLDAGGAVDLAPDLLLHFDNGIDATVAEVLKDLARFDGKTLADPLEPAYGRGRAKFYANQPSGKPVINSLAHGMARQYFLPIDTDKAFGGGGQAEPGTGSAAGDAPDGGPQAGSDGAGAGRGKRRSVKDFLSRHTLTDKDVETIDTTRFLVANLVPQGMVTVYIAEPNGGKTVLFTHFACAIANDVQVFYVNADAAPAHLKAQQEKAREHGFVILAPDMANGGGVDGLLHDLRELANADIDMSDVVLIVDTLKKFADLLDKVSLKGFLSLLRKLNAKGATLCLLAHANKYKDADGNLIFEGVGDLRADVDNMLYLYSSIASPGVREVTTKPDKVRAIFAPRSFRIQFSAFGVGVEELTEVLPPLTDELRTTLAAAREGIGNGHKQQGDLVKYCVEATMLGINNIRLQLYRLCTMDAAPLHRVGSNGPGYRFTLTSEPQSSSVERDEVKW